MTAAVALYAALVLVILGLQRVDAPGGSTTWGDVAAAATIAAVVMLALLVCWRCA